MSDPAYLVFDIESVSDGRLIQRVRFPDQPELTPAAAVAQYRAALLAASGGKSDFVPHTFHLPVAVAIAKVAPDFSLMDVKTLDAPKYRPQVITRAFWKGWQKYGRPTLVTFNGRFFDLPVLELAAYRYGLSLPSWFDSSGPGYQQPRNRFNANAHLDLQDLIGNAGAVHVNGGLNLCAQLLGKPGKMGTKGDMVQALWEAGELGRINDYCMCDALDTYFVFLRTRVLCGMIDLARERALVEHARGWIERAATTSPAMAEYLAHFQIWQPVGDDDSPFLAALPEAAVAAAVDAAVAAAAGGGPAVAADAAEAAGGAAEAAAGSGEA
jgi:predicted PolB exonuclease-like 3'-5' exonuclease